MTDTHENKPQKNETTTKRRYLPSAERKREILKVAFEEFSHRGYLGTSLERIAAKAEISKSGIYAHYSSKDDVFEDMLHSTLLPPDGNTFELSDTSDADTLSCIVDEYLNQLYERLSSPDVQAMFRLLMTESGRVPDLAHYWGKQLLDQNHTANQAFFKLGIERGLIRPDVSASDYTLAASPSLMWLMVLLVLGPQNSPVPLEEVRLLHKRLLIERLQPAPV
ncbi:MAG: TetR/AcrR family transcriptional regulator [Alcaligenes pakistanensis]